MSNTLTRDGTRDRPAAAAQGRLGELKARPREPGVASFFFHDAAFQSIAVKVLPGEYYVGDSDDVIVMTTLGSCIAVCLWDRQAGVGGLNHFMLPESDGDGDCGRYGSFAMELLINSMLKRGAKRASMEAKVFGGGQVIASMVSIQVGERNTRFAFDYLHTERIAVVGQDVLDVFPRKVCYLPATGKAMVKRLSAMAAPSVAASERAAAKAPTPAAGGAVDLF